MKPHSSQRQSAGQHPQDSTANVNPVFTAGTQQPLFEDLPGTLNDALLVRHVLIQAIRKCNKSRTQIAEEISFLTGREITEISLNKYTAESRSDYRWPGELDRAFCHVTGDDTLLKIRAELAGYQVIGSDEIKLLELGREYLRQKRAATQMASIEESLAGVEL